MNKSNARFASPREQIRVSSALINVLSILWLNYTSVPLLSASRTTEFHFSSEVVSREHVKVQPA